MVEIVPYDALESSFYKSKVNNLFYSSRWLAVLQKTYGYQWFTAWDTSSEYFILFTVIDNLTGRKIISLPFSDYTPVNPSNRESLPNIVLALREKYPHHQIVLKTELAADDPVAASLGKPTRHAIYHRIDTSNPSQITQSSSFRRGVRKAKKAEVTTEVRTDEAALSTFYQMYHQLRLEKFNSIPQPYGFFQNIYQTFIEAEHVFVLQASRQQQVIASIIVLRHQATLYYKFGCSASDSLGYRPNNLLFHRLIEIAVEKKCHTIDLGLSGTGPSYEGLRRFKESIGGVQHPITYFTLTPDEYDERTEKESKALLTALTQTIVNQKLEVEATSELSSVIYPYFA
ncbi:GNAT family N-acetyltransferase [Tunicatimonas pelagia]|uniref:GNAT family N-acetyltransferase n=1 Tax=Tunicatimonas pelagia TaxID=931531 RepID=UPI002666A8C5|nr:GNAT family N-acetyltransferase [Tunicatimonas pelagia]WKN45152.1 GNAT family N-acetyltransferase [Tunicatimonas pelagia]